MSSCWRLQVFEQAMWLDQEPLKEILSAPVNVSVVIGAMPAAYPEVIDGESRLVTES